MRSIRSLSLGRLTSSKLASEDFVDFGVELEDLKLSHSSIDSIKSHAFKNVRGVRRLDLSENSISQIDNEAFAEVFYFCVEHAFCEFFLACSENTYYLQCFFYVCNTPYQ